MNLATLETAPNSAPIPPPLALDVDEVESATAETILRRAIATWPGRLGLVTSFQAEGMVLLDMAWRLDPTLRVITLDTGRLPQETYNMMDQVRERYGIEVEVYFPNAQAVEKLLRQGGPNLFYESIESRLSCCHVRKVEPLRRALSDLDAWITGLRRGQSAARRAVSKMRLDRDHGNIVKLSPLADWSSRQVEDYIKQHNVPKHPLYARGYTSIGCAPCTRPTQAGEDPRAGRWWWEQGSGKECGLHTIKVLETKS